MKISEANRTRVVSDETKTKLRVKAKEISYTCPHCGKVGGNVMKRWHFDKCKLK